MLRIVLQTEVVKYTPADTTLKTRHNVTTILFFLQFNLFYLVYLDIRKVYNAFVNVIAGKRRVLQCSSSGKDAL